MYWCMERFRFLLSFRMLTVESVDVCWTQLFVFKEFYSLYYKNNINSKKIKLNNVDWYYAKLVLAGSGIKNILHFKNKLSGHCSYFPFFLRVEANDTLKIVLPFSPKLWPSKKIDMFTWISIKWKKGSERQAECQRVYKTVLVFHWVWALEGDYPI